MPPPHDLLPPHHHPSPPHHHPSLPPYPPPPPPKTRCAHHVDSSIAIARAGGKFGAFVELCTSGSENGVACLTNLLTSGLYFYLYNELATMTIKKTSAATQSVANTAKRVIVIVGAAITFGESLETMKMIGCSIGIGGVFLYSLVK